MPSERSAAPDHLAGLRRVAQFIREFIVSGTREGLAAARARGRVGGRATVINPHILRAARDMLPNPDASVTAKLLGVSSGTLYNHIPDLRQLRAAGRARASPAGGTYHCGAAPEGVVNIRLGRAGHPARWGRIVPINDSAFQH